jgi:hypothetical protein
MDRCAGLKDAGVGEDLNGVGSPVAAGALLLLLLATTAAHDEVLGDGE